MPQTLMGRSLLILVVPVILAQVFAVTIFWDNHWDKITQRLGGAVAGEVSIIADQLEHNYSDELEVILGNYLQTYLNIKLDFREEYDGAQDVAVQPEYNFYRQIVITPLIKALRSHLKYPHNVLIDKTNGHNVIIQIDLPTGFMRVTVPEKRLFSSSGYVFIFLLVISTFSLLMISILFLRNQIRPIRRLAAAASLMGKGRLVSMGPPRGAREVRQASEAFETMQRRIRRQIEQRTAMLAGVSHDLRTPLTRVKLGLSMMDDQAEAKTMMADLDEMEKMVDAYLEFARGEKVEDISAVPLKDFIEDILSNYHTNSIETEFVFKGQDIPIDIQKVNFRRCIENILTNSLRYASQIRVSLNITDRRVFLTIEDNGDGIPPDKYEEVFKPFVRLDPSRNKETGGAGLGLSVAMDIVLSHGGKISLDKSEDLGGLAVKIRLPV